MQLKVKLKKHFWVAARVLVLGPLAFIIIVGDYAEFLFNTLDKHMPPED